MSCVTLLGCLWNLSRYQLRIDQHIDMLRELICLLHRLFLRAVKDERLEVLVEVSRKFNLRWIDEDFILVKDSPRCLIDHDELITSPELEHRLPNVSILVGR